MTFLQYTTATVALWYYSSSITWFSTTTGGDVEMPDSVLLEPAGLTINARAKSLPLSPSSFLADTDDSGGVGDVDTSLDAPLAAVLSIEREYSKKLINKMHWTNNQQKWRIAVVAPMFESILPPPPSQMHQKNGTAIPKKTVEQKTVEHVYNLVETLVSKSHDVTLFASSDSKTSAKLIGAYPAMRENRAKPGLWNHPYIWMFEQIRQRANDFDIIHFHTIEHFAHTTPYNNKTVTTFHNQPGAAAAGGRIDWQNLLQTTKAQQTLLSNGGGHIMKSGSVDYYEKMYRKLIVSNKLEPQQHRGRRSKSSSRLVLLAAAALPPTVGGVPTKSFSVVPSTTTTTTKNHPLTKKQMCPNQQQPLRIAIVTPPILDALPPTKGGGTERMVYFLTEQLAQRGHHVTLIAPIGTKVSSKVQLKEIPYKTNPWAGKDNWLLHMMPIIASQRFVLEHAHEFDILHFHDSDHYVLMRDFIDRVVVTRHLPIDDATFFTTFRHIPMVSISNAQRKHVPKDFSTELNWIATVPNGIPLDDLHFQPRHHTTEPPYLAWMGRMAPEKGVDIAIEFALQSGIKLKIAAQLVDEHKHTYWHAHIEPLIHTNRHLVEYVGEIGGTVRDEFLGNALAFLFTPKWEEPFGLSMIEAMSTGTPAIANRRGAVPEIVQSGRNGYMFEYDDQLGVQQVANFVHLINQAAQLDRAVVRQTVEQNWSLQKMAENYETIYRQQLLLNKNHINNNC